MRTLLNSTFAWIAPVALIAAGAYFLFVNSDTGKAKGAIIQSSPQIQADADSRTTLQIKQQPSQIEIPDVGINLNVVEGDFDTNTSLWTLDHSHAFFAKNTTTPIIYSHNQKNLFLNLKGVGDNSKLYVTYPNGAQIILSYYATRFIDPNDGSILTEDHKDTIMLLTCSGIASEMRRVVYFEVQHNG